MRLIRSTLTLLTLTGLTANVFGMPATANAADFPAARHGLLDVQSEQASAAGTAEKSALAVTTDAAKPAGIREHSIDSGYFDSEESDLQIPTLKSFDGVLLALAMLLLLATIGVLIYDFVDLSSIGVETRATRRLKALRELRVLR